MLTAEEILENIAEGFITTKVHVRFKDAIKAMKQYAKLKCKEQREICADAAFHDYNYLGMSELSERIRRQPLPELK